MRKALVSGILSLTCTAVLVVSGCIKTGILPDMGNDTLAEAADYLILAPKTLFVGSDSSISMSVFTGDEHIPAERHIECALLDSNKTKVSLVRASTGESGHSVARFEVPLIEDGTYSLVAEPVGTDESYTATVRVLKSNPIFIETDKPIYKPGQTIHGRLHLLNNNLIPLADSVELEIADAKGIEVFRETLGTNDFGIATFDLPLSTKPNLGTWKIKAVSGESNAVLDIRIERYVLPKFGIESDMGKDWFLVSDLITGTVSANYLFGKPVEGSLEIEASKYVGTWETYAAYSAILENGSAEFELPAVEWIAGTYGAGGQGSLMLNISVTDMGNHTETTTELLKIVESDMILHLIPESDIVKPELPFEVLIVTEDPDGNPINADVDVRTTFRQDGCTETESADIVSTENGVAIVSYIIPGTVFYDLYANGRTVYSCTGERSEIAVRVTPQMSPSAKIVAYMINPNCEVSADVLPFDVRFETSVDLTSAFDSKTVSPGDSVRVAFDAGEKSMIGIAIGDESVYALSAGRLNLKQVFDELEKRFMEPQIGIHPEYGYYDRRIGTYEIIDDAGMQVLASSSFKIPKTPESEMQVPGAVGKWKGGANRDVFAVDVAVEESLDGASAVDGTGEPVPGTAPNAAETGELALVKRVRQFFPETWLWLPNLLTDKNGRTQIDLIAPDSITTWRLHAVSSSDAGIGISEDNLTVFQEFFLDPDLPYSVTRGEIFPVRVQVYNYLNMPQDVGLTLSSGGWFNSIGDDVASVSIGANRVEDVSFTITPTKIGTHAIEITAQTERMADAVKNNIIVEAEGTRQEIIENGNLEVGSTTLDAALPQGIVSDSGVVLVSFTQSIVAQTINGIDSLLDMPYGCGEQNMIMFAPDVEILRYLKATDQTNPEIQAKAELFITTGYQRQLTFRHNDGSFSAFGEGGGEGGSLWLTAFVLNSFSSARDVTSIDDSILEQSIPRA